MRLTAKKGGPELELPPQRERKQKVFPLIEGEKIRKKGQRAEATFNPNLSLRGQLLKGSLELR